MSAIKFSPGSVYTTPGCLAAFEQSGDDLMAHLIRHITGDWGDCVPGDRHANDQALIDGSRILSVYQHEQRYEILGSH